MISTQFNPKFFAINALFEKLIIMVNEKDHLNNNSFSYRNCL